MPGSGEWEDDQMAYLDKLVGNVLNKLDELGLRENTLVVFTSDNGPGSDGAVAEGFQRLPGSKGGVLEGATRVPCVLSWPGTVPAGSKYDGLVDFTDFAATFAQMAGVEPPKNVLDGQSFLPQMKGKTGDPREWIYFHGGWNDSATRMEMIRGVDWKFKPRVPPGQSEKPRVQEKNFNFRYVRGTRYKLYSDGRFYDLQTDLAERRPLAPGAGSAQAEAARAKLQAVLDRHPKRRGEPKFSYAAFAAAATAAAK